MNRNKLKPAYKEQYETNESLVDLAFREIDRAILPDFFPRLLAINPELSAQIGAADSRVSRAYRGGDTEELGDALEAMRELYMRGSEIVYSR